MRRLVVVAALAFAAPSLAFAHVTVRPRESKAGADEKYTVRVPTEGTVATTHVQLEIPAGVAVLEVMPQDGATFETSKQGDRITAITWRKEIPPKASAEFVFSARNPAMGDLVWKAHQHFADGTAADWVGAAGERRPASITKLAATIAEQPIDSSGLPLCVAEWFVRPDGRSELEVAFAKNPRLQAAHLQLLSVGEQRDVRSAGHQADLGDDVDVGERASSKPDEPAGIEALFEIFQTIGDGVAFIPNRRDVQQLAVGHD